MKHGLLPTNTVYPGLFPYVQGVPMQTVKSNLDQTERKNAINFNLKVDSDQGRLGIYP